MKAKELMIGDWVHCDYRESSTEDIRESYDCRVNSLDDDYNINSNSEECYSPIPLTEEILKANGFEKITDFVYKHPTGVKYECYGNHIITYKSNTICEIFNTHELQHALRLCGLNDLADGFKLT